MIIPLFSWANNLPYIKKINYLRNHNAKLKN